MRFFARFAPVRAYRDLRGFLAQRQPHELWFLILAVGLTAAAIALFARNDYPVQYREPDIVYFKQWRADRSEAEILAQQKIDAPAEAKAKADQKRRIDARRAEFQHMNDAMNRWGL